MHSTEKVLTIILAMLLPAVSFAKFVNQDKAQQIAQSFFTENSTKAATAKVGVELVWPTKATRAEGQPAYYIFNKSDATGFVIVSAETEAPQILAYSNEGAFHVDLIDKGADLFLNSYSEAIGQIRQGAGTKAASDFDSEVILKTVNWNQGDVFFNDKYAPTQYAMPCPAGCGATAMAIIMKYHNWPPKATGSHSYYCETLNRTFSCDFDSLTIDWNISEYPMNEQESDELSKIQQACGVALNMKYAAQESWCYILPVTYALPHYFYYETPYYMNRLFYTDDEWATFLKNEIDENRPAMVCGADRYDNGHLFVLDGYETHGLFHYNLGWGGMNNGFYYDSFVSYTYSVQQAVVGIQPRPLDIEDHTSPVSYSDIKVRPEGNIKNNYPFIVEFEFFANISGDTLDTRLRLDVYDKDDAFKFTVYEETNWKIGLYPSFLYDYINFRIIIPSDKPILPTDQLCLSTSDDEGKTWQRVYTSSSAFRTYTFGGHEKDAVMVSPIAFQMMDDSGLDLPNNLITPDQRFSITANRIYNYGNNVISGMMGLAIVDTTTYKIKYYLKTEEFRNLQINYGWREFVFRDMMIPTSKLSTFKSTDAIMMIARPNGESNYIPVFNWDLTPNYIPLQSVLEVDLDKVPTLESDVSDSPVYSIDGRMSDQPSGKGLYLKRSGQGQVTKYYYTE